jgi:hypothetical protein
MTSQHEQMNKLDDPGQVALPDDASFIEGNGEMVPDTVGQQRALEKKPARGGLSNQRRAQA